MANAKIVSLVDHEIERAIAQPLAEIEDVQTQIISKINEVLAICAALRADVDALMGKGGLTH